MQVREKVAKSRNTVARWEMKNCTPLGREAHFQVKMYKTHHSRTTFGSWDVEKVHAVVARSTFRSQNVQNTPRSNHFWKLRCRKRARRFGAKHISKSKCTRHTMFGALLEVEMMKKCTPLQREAHVQVKMYKTHQLWSTFGSWDIEKVHAVVARSTCPSQNVQTTPFSDHFWKLRCSNSARRCGAKHISKSKCTKHTRFWALFEVDMLEKCTPLWREAHFQVKMLKKNDMFGPLLDVQMSFRVAGARDCEPCQKWAKHEEGFVAVSTTTTTTLHTPNYTPLHSTTLHYNTLHYNHNYNYNYTELHYTTLHYTNYNYSYHYHYITLHNTT